MNGIVESLYFALDLHGARAVCKPEKMKLASGDASKRINFFLRHEGFHGGKRRRKEAIEPKGELVGAYPFSGADSNCFLWQTSHHCNRWMRQAAKVAQQQENIASWIQVSACKV